MRWSRRLGRVLGKQTQLSAGQHYPANVRPLANIPLTGCSASPFLRHMQKPQPTTCRIAGLEIEVTRKKVKNLSLRVCPPDGTLKLTAPLRASEEAIRSFVAGRLQWIERHVDVVRNRVVSKPPEFVTGSIHCLAGQEYRLNVIQPASINRIVLRDSYQIELRLRPEATPEQVKRFYVRWHHSLLQGRIEALLSKWQPLIGVSVAGYGIRSMKSRWGTCNIKARRILINLELAKHSDACLEYIVVHELVHLLVRYHDARFYACMDSFLPAWRAADAELKKHPPVLM